MLRALILTSSFAVALVLLASESAVIAAPVLQLPWPTGAQHRINNGGNTYNCGSHWRLTATSSTAYNANYHAIDFQFTQGEDIAAAAAGTVVVRGNAGDGYGNKVVLDHGAGYYSVYAHFQDGSTWGPGIVLGANVAQGQLVGYAGNTGGNYDVHLHFHMQSNLDALTPEPMSLAANFGSYGACPYANSPYFASFPTGFQILTLNTGFDEATPVCGGAECEWHRLIPQGGGTTTATVLSSPNPGTPPNFVRLRSSPAGGSIYQDVVSSCPPGDCTVKPSPGDSYVFTIWARSATSGVCVNATVVLWSMPGGTEHGSAPFQVCTASWKVFAAPLDALQSNTYLRAQVYVDDANKDVDIDATQLIQLRTENSSFEAGDPCPSCPWWKTFPGGYTTNAVRFWDPSRVTEVPVGGGAAGGNYLLRANVTGGSGGGSIYQDIPVVTVSGEVYKVSIRLRSRTSGVSVSGSVVLWGINGPGNNESASVPYTVFTRAWQEFTVTKSMTQAHTAVRVQVYINTPANQDVEIDGARFYKAN